jgi:hypothetical protein
MFMKKETFCSQKGTIFMKKVNLFTRFRGFFVKKVNFFSQKRTILMKKVNLFTRFGRLFMNRVSLSQQTGQIFKKTAAKCSKLTAKIAFANNVSPDLFI